MVARHRQFDVAAVTRTLWRFETACCAAVVLELPKLGSVEAAGDGVEQGVEGEGGGDALGGQGTDVGGEEEAEVDAGQVRRDGLRGIHLCAGTALSERCLLRLVDRKKTNFWRSRESASFFHMTSRF